MRVRLMKRYEPAFREQAISLLEQTDRTLNQVATSLGVPYATLGYWYKQEMARRRGKPKAAAAAPATPALVAPATETLQQKLLRLERENAALRREIDDLKLDKDILKKAAAFFVKESK